MQGTRARACVQLASSRLGAWADVWLWVHVNMQVQSHLHVHINALARAVVWSLSSHAPCMTGMQAMLISTVIREYMREHVCEGGRGRAH